MHVRVSTVGFQMLIRKVSSKHLCVGRLELDIIWDQVSAASAVQQEPLNPGSASAWRVHVIDPAHAQTYGHSAFSLHVRHRRPCDSPVYGHSFLKACPYLCSCRCVVLGGIYS